MENNYQLSRIHNYINGLLSKEEMFELEKEALDDPFLQDALDGYGMQRGVDVKRLSLLQQRLNRRVEDVRGIRHTQYYSWQRLAVGATAAVIFVALLALLYFQHFNARTERITTVELREPVGQIIVTPLLEGGDAMPEVGWRAFDRYVEALQIDVTGRAEIQFDVDKNGHATNIRVLAADHEEVGERAITILKNGPKWSGSKGRISFVFPE